MAFLEGVGIFESTCFSMNDSAYRNQHRVTHKKVKEKMAWHLGVNTDSVDIRKNIEGIPFIYVNDSPISSYLSISHHGKYGAFAFTKLSL